jgi:DNA adenine methylase
MQEILAIIVRNDDDMPMKYPGGKGKCFHQLINLMPSHHTYIESHLGGGAVMRNKRPAARNIGIDFDPTVIQMWGSLPNYNIELVTADAATYLSSFEFDGGELIYLDPPYLPRTRRQQRLYRFEYSEQQHNDLLEVIRSLPCKVMISGYDDPFYDRLLVGWNKEKFLVNSQVGRREECVWFNFERPDSLHDSTYLGKTYRERQTVKRRRNRMRERIQKMDAVERCELMNWMIANFGEDRIT